MGFSVAFTRCIHRLKERQLPLPKLQIVLVILPFMTPPSILRDDVDVPAVVADKQIVYPREVGVQNCGAKVVYRQEGGYIVAYVCSCVWGRVLHPREREARLVFPLHLPFGQRSFRCGLCARRILKPNVDGGRWFRVSRQYWRPD